jgi:predicted  nucleic acid-binding Zn-ribbon protein
MSSPASKRTTKRKADKSPLGQLKKQLSTAQKQAGEARMAVLNMRQMYRQAEQEILMLRQQLQQKETLAAAIMYVTENYSVQLTKEVLEDLSEEFSHIDVRPHGEATLVVLVPAEDIEDEEPDEDE